MYRGGELGSVMAVKMMVVVGIETKQQQLLHSLESCLWNYDQAMCFVVAVVVVVVVVVAAAVACRFQWH